MDTTRTLDPIVKAYDLAFVSVASIESDPKSRHELIFTLLGTPLFMVV